ncbi:hypothetical protein HXY32_00910 [Candidatus Bathyarchaeota archaeon]|nr:hypothetical protein [Candidatus Bathyarchaeota archaeon]
MIKVKVSEEKVAKDEEDIKAIIKYVQVDLKMLKSKAEKEKTISILNELIGQKE